MSEPQHEQLSALLDTIYEGFTAAVAASRGKSVAEVGARPWPRVVLRWRSVSGGALLEHWSALPDHGIMQTCKHQGMRVAEPSRAPGLWASSQHTCRLARGALRSRTCWSAACMT